MDALMLSRLQFAAATYFHFIFVPLTLGLSVMLAIWETKYVKTMDETYKRMVKFWGKLFLINFALGVVTGITLEFQFGTNWSRYSAYVGDIFGSLLAIEATVAFFLESTFIAVWVFGWKKLSPKMHATSIWLVAIAGNISALWILIANGWMQHPVGYEIVDGRAVLTNFWAVMFNPFAWHEFVHTVSASWMLSGFFVLGISAWHLRRKNETEVFGRSFKLGAVFALLFALVVAGQGHFHGNEVARVQPAKLAAMEAHWETEKGAGMALLQLPDVENERNMIEAIKIPKLLSLLAFNDPNAEVKGLKDFPEDERPPVWINFISFRVMVGLGGLFILVGAWAWLSRKKPGEKPLLMKILIYMIPLPYLAIFTGWTLAEVGRQPWIVYGMMKTSVAFSPAVTSTQVGVSLAAFLVVYGLLGAVGIYLLRKYAQKGPE